MATYKKKDFSKNFNEEEIEELVDGDGGLIGGNTKNFNSDSEVMTDTPYDGSEEADQDYPLTTDKHVSNTRQRRRYPWGYGYAASATHAVRESQKILAKERMEDLIEDLMSDRSDNRDMVKGGNVQDINRNKIPDIEDITNNNQALSSTLKSVIDIMNGQDVNGESVGVILNYIISNVNTNDIPQDYKRIIRGKI